MNWKIYLYWLFRCYLSCVAPHDLAAGEVAPAGQLEQLQLVVAAEGEVGGVLGVGVPASPANLPSAAPRHLHIITILISTVIVFFCSPSWQSPAAPPCRGVRGASCWPAAPTCHPGTDRRWWPAAPWTGRWAHRCSTPAPCHSSRQHHHHSLGTRLKGCYNNILSTLRCTVTADSSAASVSRDQPGPGERKPRRRRTPSR